MRPRQYRVKLSLDDRSQLEQLLRHGTAKATTLTHARILLKADEGDHGPTWSDQRIAEALEVGLATVSRVRCRFAQQGLTAALERTPSARVYARKLDGVQEAHLIALACVTPDVGQGRWSLRLLAEKMVELQYVESLSHETVRQVLQKTNSSRT